MKTAASCKMIRDDKNRYKFEESCNAIGNGQVCFFIKEKKNKKEGINRK